MPHEKILEGLAETGGDRSMRKKVNQKEQNQRAFRLLDAIGGLPEEMVGEALETMDHAILPDKIHRYRRRPLRIASATAAVLVIAILSGSIYLQITGQIPSETRQPDTSNSSSHKSTGTPSEPPETETMDEISETDAELKQTAQKPLPDGTISLLSTVQRSNEKKQKTSHDIEDNNLNTNTEENGSKDSASQKHITEEDVALKPLTAREMQPLSEIKKTKKNLSISFTLQIGNKHDQTSYHLECNDIIWHIQGKTGHKKSKVQCDGGSTLTATLQFPVKNNKIQANIDTISLPDDTNPDFSPFACITITSYPNNTIDINENATGTGQLFIGTIQDYYYILYHS